MIVVIEERKGRRKEKKRKEKKRKEKKKPKRKKEKEKLYEINVEDKGKSLYSPLRVAAKQANVVVVGPRACHHHPVRVKG